MKFLNRIVDRFSRVIPLNIFGTLERVDHLFSDAHLVVLAAHYYHRGEGTEVCERTVIDNLEYLEHSCNVLPFRDAVARIEDGKSLPRRAVSLVVDDATLPFFRIGWPLLEGFRNLPFTLSVVPGLIRESSKDYQIGRLMRAITKGYGSYGGRTAIKIAAELLSIDLKTENEDCFEILFAEVSGMEYDDLQEVLERLKACDEDFMSWDQLALLSSTGRVDLVSHSMSHPRLRYATGEWLEWELGRSKAIIEDRIGGNVDTFVFPYGGKKEVTDAVRESLKKYGYRFGLLTAPGVVSGKSDRFLIPRMPGEVSTVEFRRNTNGFLGKISHGNGIGEKWDSLRPTMKR